MSTIRVVVDLVGDVDEAAAREWLWECLEESQDRIGLTTIRNLTLADVTEERAAELRAKHEGRPLR